MSTTDLPGSSLLAGRYRLVERLGAGGMSVVWRGFDEVLGRQVAVKVLPPSTSADPAFRRRLRAEAQAAARLSHPHITNVYDYGEATTVDGEPVPYVVMELIDGESLAAVLARARKLPWQHAVRITAEVAAALAAAHARGIVHRDVTPANVMLTPTGAKVVDFGISALIGENDIDPDGSLLGTPAYLAPERLEGGQVSPATDVYAVGLLIYRTLIGQLPWDVGTTTALLRAHQYTEPEPLPPVEGLPASVDALVGRCLEKRPADRPSSAELANILAAISAGAPSTARGYVPDWAESGEDTTILPMPRGYPDIIVAAPMSPPPMNQPPVNQPPVAPPPMPEPVQPPAAPMRNSRFAALESGPVVSPESPLRPAWDTGPTPPEHVLVRGGDQRTARVHSKTRRILVSAGAVLLLGLGTYGWSLTSEPRSANGALPQPIVVPPTGKCVVSYSVWEDKDGRFSAQVTLANRNDTAVKDWKLWFILPGDQTISGNGKVQLAQRDREITVASEATLSPQRAVTLPITGRYVKNNTAPMAFELNGRTCTTFVSAKPGEPSRQVEHLSDGDVRLGAIPSSDSPIPGTSVDPDGVIVITPTVKPSTTTRPTDKPGKPDTPDKPSESASPVPTTPVAPEPVEGGHSSSASASASPSTVETTTQAPPPGGTAPLECDDEGSTDPDCLTGGE